MSCWLMKNKKSMQNDGKGNIEIQFTVRNQLSW